MVDVFSKRKRSELMSRVKTKDTTPETAVRSLLHHMGYRFRLHVRSLPGTPDIVLPRHKKIIFVNGCFWHGHRRCRKATMPSTNADFWKAKIDANRKRDARVKRKLRRMGWSVMTVWECRLSDMDALARSLDAFIRK